MASRTINDSSGRLEPLVPGTQSRRAGKSGWLLVPTPKALAGSLVIIFLLSVILVESRPVAAVSGTLEVIQSGLKEPVALAFAPDGRVFFAERPVGKIWIIANGSLLPNPFYTFDGVSDYHDQGLLGLALDPSFPSTHWVYAQYTFNDTGTFYDRIVRIQANGNSGESMEVLLDRIPTGEWHIGGPIQFGPDGKLYVTTGDNYIAANAQDLTTLAGKVLRLNPDGSVPEDNPFVGNASVNPYIYTYGHRNLFGIAFHPITHAVFVTENGPECNDEVNLLVPGRNYGWGPTYSCSNPPPDPLNTNRDGPDPVLPLISYTPEIAPTNAIFHDGPTFAAWHDDLFFGTWNTRNVHRVHLAPPRYDTVLSDEVVVTLPAGEYGGVVGLGQGLDGAIWLTSLHTIYRFYDTSLPPTASFTASPSAPVVGDTVTFNATGSFDPDGSVVSYSWDFGDGVQASGPVVTHVYSTYGEYEATLVVTDIDHLTASHTASILVFAPPEGSFAFGPLRPVERSSVTFNASYSTDPDGTIAEYRWDWGDGSDPVVSSFYLGTHTFATFGEYLVRLTVTDSHGLQNVTSTVVYVFAAPSAAFTFSPSTARVGQVVTLNGSASFDPDGSIVLYSWDFGDGTTGSGRMIEHSFSTDGNYPITLTVTDTDDFTSTASTTVSVASLRAPAASFTASATVVAPGDEVTFNASRSSDSDGTIVRYTWDFGDASTGSGITPVHAYVESGSYTVTLTVVDDTQLATSTSQNIRVNAPPTAAFVTESQRSYPRVPITFDASGSADSDGAIVFYQWSFGDGTATEGKAVVHMFEDHGTFTVHLVVTDDLDARAEATKTMEIGNRQPVVLSTSPEAKPVVNAAEPTTFRVNASDPDGDPLAYAWTVNGISVGETSPKYQFVPAQSGAFVVKVVVSDGSAVVAFEWTVEVRERSGSSGFPVASLSIGIGATSTIVLALVGLLLLRRRRR